MENFLGLDELLLFDGLFCQIEVFRNRLPLGHDASVLGDPFLNGPFTPAIPSRSKVRQNGVVVVEFHATGAVPDALGDQ